jgi:hypothetical protein
MLCRSEYDIATYFSADEKSWYFMQQNAVFFANNEDNEGPSIVVDSIAALGLQHPCFHLSELELSFVSNIPQQKARDW